MSVLKGFTAKQPVKSGQRVTIEPTGVYVNGRLEECRMRHNQLDVFQHHRNKRLFIVTQPPGSGKSMLVKFVHGHDLIDQPNRKLIIAVPTTYIAKTFRKVILEMPDGSKLNWDITNDLCFDISDSKVAEVVRFINKKKFPRGIHERVLICTHAALSKAWKQVRNKRTALRNTTVVIDEAHHILYAQNGAMDAVNQLGRMMRKVLEVDDPTTKVWLVTATFFRGDKLSILTEDESERFGRSFLPFDQHWEQNIQYMKSYSFDFVVYKHEPWKEIRTILKKHKRKTIIYCPAMNEKLANGCKYTFVEQLKKEIHKVWRNACILDLVDENGRELRKEHLMDEETSDDPDIVLTVDLLNEGADWEHAEQIIDLSPTQSLRLLVQRFGRLTRDKKGKKHVHYWMFLPFVIDQLDEGKYRRNLSQVFTAFTASLLLEEYIKPIPIKTAVGSKAKSNGKNNSKYVNYFAQAVPDEGRRIIILGSIYSDLVELRSACVDEKEILPSTSAVQRCIEMRLSQEGVRTNLFEIACQIAGMFRRRLLNNGTDLAWMVDCGFDKIWKDDIWDDLLLFGSGFCGCKSFVEFRSVLSNRKTLDQWLLIAEEIAHQNNGVLPHQKWLVDHGHAGLVRFMFYQPEVFAHIPQDTKKGKSLKEHLSDAEMLAANHRGVLPNMKWLADHGYNGLAQCIMKNRAEFSHLEQAWKGGKSQEEWLAIAGELAAEHGGTLPNQEWLVKHGYSGLKCCIVEHPDSFAHLEQNRLLKTPDEWVKIAEGLADDHGGLLPECKWLLDSGFSALQNSMWTYPHLFKHIRRKRAKPRNVQENLELAQRLSKEHGGWLPTRKWLTDHGFGGLYECMRTHPGEFSHIKRSKGGVSRAKCGHFTPEGSNDLCGTQYTKYRRCPECGGLAHGGGFMHKGNCSVKKQRPTVLCKICGVEKRHAAKGICDTCYKRLQYQNRSPRECPQCGETRKFVGRVCKKCYKTPKVKCKSCGLLKHHFARGFCKQCYRRPEKPCKQCGKVTKIVSNGLCRKCAPRKMIVCKVCQKTAPHWAKGVCVKCYPTYHYREKRSKEEMSTV